MKTCYQCDMPAEKLSPRSRCVTCEYERANVNEDENEGLRAENVQMSHRLRRGQQLLSEMNDQLEKLQ